MLIFSEYLSQISLNAIPQQKYFGFVNKLVSSVFYAC